MQPEGNPRWENGMYSLITRTSKTWWADVLVDFLLRLFADFSLDTYVTYRLMATIITGHLLGLLFFPCAAVLKPNLYAVSWKLQHCRKLWYSGCGNVVSVLVAFLQVQELLCWKWHSWATTYLPSVDSLTISWPCNKIANISLTFNDGAFSVFFIFFLLLLCVCSAFVLLLSFSCCRSYDRTSVFKSVYPSSLKKCLNNWEYWGRCSKAHAHILGSLFSLVFYVLNNIKFVNLLSLLKFTWDNSLVVTATSRNITVLIYREVITIENTELSKLTWNFWGRIPCVRQPRKIAGYRSFCRQRRSFLNSFSFLAGNTIGRK